VKIAYAVHVQSIVTCGFYMPQHDSRANTSWYILSVIAWYVLYIMRVIVQHIVPLLYSLIQDMDMARHRYMDTRNH